MRNKISMHEDINLKCEINSDPIGFGHEKWNETYVSAMLKTIAMYSFCSVEAFFPTCSWLAGWKLQKDNHDAILKDPSSRWPFCTMPLTAGQKHHPQIPDDVTQKTEATVSIQSTIISNSNLHFNAIQGFSFTRHIM